MAKAVEVESLTVHYDKVPVLWEVSFEIPEGGLIGIIGPNGAGKSTLIRTLLGLHKPVSGTVRLLGHQLQDVQNRIAYVPQRTSVDWTFPISVLDVVVMGRYGKLGLLKWVRRKDKMAAYHALEKVGMHEYADRQISELSGGQQQRVFLARALLQEADLYFMDEPFAGVDMATENALLELMSGLKEEGKTLLIVHHDLATVKEMFDWVILLNTCLIDSGPCQEVLTQENIQKAYGNASYLLNETKKLTKTKSRGV